LNEPLVSEIDQDVLTSFYLLMHDTLRNVTGIGAGKGPFLSVHDGFLGLSAWSNLLPGSDRLALDEHPYLIFGDLTIAPLADMISLPCSTWASDMNTSWSTYGVSTAGEWSLAVNDCGLYLNGVGQGSRYAGTLDGYDGPTSGLGADACDSWNDYQSWNETMKEDFIQFAYSTMDALQHWFFWTWKVGASSVTGQIESPMWSYQLALAEGFMPTDPRGSVGACGGGSPTSPLTAEETGGAGAGDISDAVREQSPWPPVSVNPGPWLPTQLPSYTATGPIPTLPPPTGTPNAGDGWFDAQDTRPMYTPIAGCTYPDAWNADNVDVPPLCPEGAAIPVATAII